MLVLIVLAVVAAFSLSSPVTTSSGVLSFAQGGGSSYGLLIY